MSDIEKEIDEIVLKPALWQADDYRKAKAALTELVERKEKEAFLAGQKKGKNNYHLGYLSKDDQYAIEREINKARVDELKKLLSRRTGWHPDDWGVDCIYKQPIKERIKRLRRRGNDWIIKDRAALSSNKQGGK